MLVMKQKAAKLRKSRGPAKKAAATRKSRTLAECEAWFAANWDRAMAAAKANTKRLTGRETL